MSANRIGFCRETIVERIEEFQGATLVDCHETGR
jgi:hypothetical protein